MVLTKHPDATAFAARFLAQPDDRLGRLVFADWLEEQGGESNTAWADYIRTQAELETVRWNDPRGRELTFRLAELSHAIRAKLYIRVSRPIQLQTLPKFLPPTRCVVRLPEYWDYHSACEQVPRELADRYLLLPLYADGRNVYLAASSRDDPLRNHLAGTLNANVHMFGIEPTVSARDIEWEYTRTGRYRINAGAAWTMANLWPEYDPLTVLFDEMINGSVCEVSFEGDQHGVGVAYLTDWGWRERDPLSVEEFCGLLGWLRLRIGMNVLPVFPELLDFRHEYCLQPYVGTGHLSMVNIYPRLWLRLHPAGDPASTEAG